MSQRQFDFGSDADIRKLPANRLPRKPFKPIEVPIADCRRDPNISCDKGGRVHCDCYYHGGRCHACHKPMFKEVDL